MKSGDLIKIKWESYWLPVTKKTYNDGIHSIPFIAGKIGLLVKFIGNRPQFNDKPGPTGVSGTDYWIVFCGNGCYYISEKWMEKLNN